jgi:hypothetical protein
LQALGLFGVSGQRCERNNRLKSAGVLARMNPMADPAAVSITRIRHPNIDRLCEEKNRRACGRPRIPVLLSPGFGQVHARLFKAVFDRGGLLY